MRLSLNATTAEVAGLFVHSIGRTRDYDTFSLFFRKQSSGDTYDGWVVLLSETSKWCETPVDESGSEILGQGRLEKITRVRKLSELSIELGCTSVFKADSLRSPHVLKHC